MALKNSQYDMMIRTYNKKQLENKHRQDAHIAEAYAHIPELKELDAATSTLSISTGKKLLGGDINALSGLKEELAALALHRTSLLTKHGYSENFLELTYTCPDCQDTGYQNNKKCHCFRQAVIDMLYTQSNIREILKEENFDHLSYDYYSETSANAATGLSSLATAKKAAEECRQFVARFDEDFQNLFFYGDTGVGKTFLSHCIAKELIESAHSVIYFSAFELFDIIARKTFYKEDDAQNMHPYIFNCDLLIIDDLGTELTNSFVSSQLFQCINERLNRKKSTIISTNLPIHIFADTYSERIFSRITSNYTMLKLFGDDIRIQKKLSGRKP